MFYQVHKVDKPHEGSIFTSTKWTDPTRVKYLTKSTKWTNPTRVNCLTKSTKWMDPTRDQYSCPQSGWTPRRLTVRPVHKVDEHKEFLKKKKKNSNIIQQVHGP